MNTITIFDLGKINYHDYEGVLGRYSPTKESIMKQFEKEGKVWHIAKGMLQWMFSRADL